MPQLISAPLGISRKSPMQIVIDKSYLQSTSTEKFRVRFADDTILFTESLLYELLTTKLETVRHACFTKLS